MNAPRALAAAVLALAALSPALFAAQEAGLPPDTPEALRAWAGAEYPVRYFLRVEPPPASGSAALQPEPEVAAVYLPLRVFPAAGAPQEGQAAPPRVEAVLLVAEDGEVQPIFVRPVKGGNEVEVAFPSRLAKRRCCLYAGAPDGRAQQASPLAFQPRALTVGVRGSSAPAAYTPGGPPLTLARFQELRLTSRVIGEVRRRAIADPDPPFEDLRFRTGDPEKSTVLQDPQYAAVYEGFLRIPLKGKYDFALTTFGAGCLLVDGKEVLRSGEPDPKRGPFALTGTAELRAGLHRAVVYYLQAGAKSGVALAWRPPWSRDFVTVPAQAFPRGLPAVISAVEGRAGLTSAIHVELAAHYRTAPHAGPQGAREWLYVYAQAVGAPRPGGTLRFTVAGQEPSAGPASGACVLAPAGVPVQIEWLAGEQLVAQRTVLFPKEADGARDVMDLTGELALKAAPHFLYTDETAQFHLESQLSSIPQLVPKARLERGPPLPLYRPQGQFRLRWVLHGLPAAASGTAGGEEDATPDDSGRRKIRVPLEVAPLLDYLGSRNVRLELSLYVGGLLAESHVFRLLHSRDEWPAGLCVALDHLELPAPEETPEGGGAGVPARPPTGEDARGSPPTASELVLVVVPREVEASYRRFRPPLLSGGGAPVAANTALFLGDPLVESATDTPPGTAIGLAARLARAMPGKTWSAVCLPGPHRGLFVFPLLAAAEDWVGRTPAETRAALAVVCLGGGDAARQTPLYDFERGVDVLVDRLNRAGVLKVFFAGELPEPGHVRQAEGYQARLTDLLRQHHCEVLDLFSLWTKEPGWERRFRLEADSPTPAYGPVPNAAALDEIVELLKNRLP